MPTPSWPRYEYDGTNHVAIVQLMPTPINGMVHSSIQNNFAVALSSMSLAVRRQFRAQGAVDQILQHGQYFSVKAPDFELLSDVEGDGVQRSVMVVEMGFSQSYESLRQDVEEWFNGSPSMRMVILVDINEKPRYQNPLRGLPAKDIIRLLAATTKQEAVEPQPGFPWAGFYLRGFPFVGVLEGNLEVWIRGPDRRAKMRNPRHVSL